MADVRDSRTHLTPATPSGTGGGSDMSAFYAEVSGFALERAGSSVLVADSLLRV